MEEQNTNLEEQMADQQDAFLEGWDGTQESEAEADQQNVEEQGTEQEAQEEQNGSEGEENSGADDGEVNTDPETKGEGEDETAQHEPAQEAPKTWSVKRMGEEMNMGVDDITPELLQKGLDYDRVRGKYDEAKPVMEMFTELAKGSGLSVPEYVKFIREEVKKAGGMSETEAKRAVELEDREAAVSAKEAEQQESNNAETEQKAKIKADLRDFANAFPEVYKKAKDDPAVIPDKVWEYASAGNMTITAAYAKFVSEKAAADVAAANSRAETEIKNSKNAYRSSGSQRSAGNDTKNKDPFLEGWG